jgi:hypothetical protein
MEEWAKKNCPQARVISLEAVDVLAECDDQVNRIALQEGISVEDAWKKIL